MSILNVEPVTHGFGARQILNDASFRLLKGEHVGLVGANGEGKSTFLNIIMGKLQPDEGKIEWCRHITTGYLDQYPEDFRRKYEDPAVCPDLFLLFYHRLPYDFRMRDGRTLIQTAPWTMIYPGLAIFITVVVFNMLGDSLRDILDPKSE